MYMRCCVKFLQGAEKLGLTITIKIRTEDNRADILTKMLHVSSKTDANGREDAGQDPERGQRRDQHPHHQIHH